MIASIDERNFNKERMIIMPYKNKKGILNLLLFLALSTITFSNENNKRTEKVNSEGFVRYHEIITHINSFKNNPKESIENIDEDNFKLEIESK